METKVSRSVHPTIKMLLGASQKSYTLSAPRCGADQQGSHSFVMVSGANHLNSQQAVRSPARTTAAVQSGGFAALRMTIKPNTFWSCPELNNGMNKRMN